MTTTLADTTQTTPKGPMGQVEFAARYQELNAKYGANAALKMVRRERKLRHPLHKRATARNVEIADTAIAATGEFHSI